VRTFTDWDDELAILPRCGLHRLPLRESDAAVNEREEMLSTGLHMSSDPNRSFIALVYESVRVLMD